MNIFKCLVIVAIIATAILTLAMKLYTDSMAQVHAIEAIEARF